MLRSTHLLVLIVALLATPSALAETTQTHHHQTRLGIDVLADANFALLRGKRVGLVAHAAGVNAELVNSADVLFDAQEQGGFELVGLYGPEHGVYGDAYAGDKVEDQRDRRTGIKMYSLYGDTRKPTPEMLAEVDVLLVDLQDIGARSYTYISTMALAVEACIEQGKAIVILDRPNPLGGERVEGGMVHDQFRSFVSQLDVPYLHGMTMGELALFEAHRVLKEMAKTDDSIRPNAMGVYEYEGLHVVKMEHWARAMVWEDTGLTWVQTSPHIPTMEAAYAYPTTGILGELYVINIGVGYTIPFETVADPTVEDAFAFADQLRSHPLMPTGVTVRPMYYKPYYSVHEGELCAGVQVYIDPHGASSLSELNFVLIDVLGIANTLAEAPDRHDMFNKVNGSDRELKAL
ncbi:MAG: DUF1343 domain-containing protein, partial [Planctomycetota bacterium]